jgi:ABC-2 type transport system permease protein/lipopolysaccharide transport system permease protein
VTEVVADRTFDGAQSRTALASLPLAPGRVRLSRALSDLYQGTWQAWIWSSMAWQDIRQRYRGSILGPFWLTISMAILIGTLGLLYSRLFNLEIDTYLPFLTLGITVWTFISTVVTEGCNCFLSAETIITQIKMPFTVHVHRTLYRNLIVLGHNAIVFVAVLVVFEVPFDAGAMMAIPGMLTLIVNGVWVCLLLGMISARFRDIAPIVASFMQIFFFVTPIMWDPASLHGQHLWLVDYNPFYAMIEIVRGPLMGRAVDVSLWQIALITTVLGWLLSFAFFVRFRARIPFWV